MNADRSRSRMGWLISAVAGCILTSAWAEASAGHFIEAWYSPPVAPMPNWCCREVRVFTDQTIRQLVRLETGGRLIRLRLTNELGLSTTTVSEVHLAVSSANGTTEPATDHVVTFGGRRSATLVRGQPLVSDPVELPVRRFQDLAISVYYSGRVTPSGHRSQLLVSPAGNHAAQSDWPRAGLEEGPGVVSGIEIASATPHPVLVAFGDSITEGDCSTSGAHRDYPEQLARLLAQSPTDRRWVVINSGISGNQMLLDGAGPRALSRFDRDALEIPGVSAIVVLEGINDINNQDGPEGHRTLSAQMLIAAYHDLIQRAHARGVKIYLGTLTPYGGTKYYTPSGDKVREQVNAWIRRSRDFDGAIDFDAALRDPAHPRRYIGGADCGDHLHPSDSGYRLMAQTAFRQLFRQGASLATR